MFKTKCRCGKSEKSFKMNIGEFYIDECCEKAGYDQFGKLPEDYENPETTEEVVDEIVEEVQDATEELPEEVAEEVMEDMVETFQEQLEKLDIDKLREMCDEKGIKYAKNTKAATMIKKLVAAVE